MLYYITGNKNKINVAEKFLNKYGISFIPKDLSALELQSDSIEEVVIHKAKDAFSKFKKPLFVSDHFWSIPALGGFPGAYMKHINKWFKPSDLLNLMASKKNRKAILTEMLCYIDKNTMKTFKQSHTGTVLKQSQGKGFVGFTVISLTNDGLSVAQKIEKDPSALEEDKLWEDFAKWYKDLK